ncbi:hypothetical protein SSX86_022852 [Deinandra increscens subsp. villosa]|uniref:GUN4-like domain-containing protein n=1 Tax=Deinandra increscens subsp. villosa TaxID=3103831 RepID=A0AAP0CPZ3_9ASTR
MSTHSLQSPNYRHRTLPLGRRHLLASPPPTLALNQKSNNGSTNYSQIISISPSPVKAAFSVTSTSSAAAQSTSFDLLSRLLSANDFREADNETRRLLIALAGEAAQKRGYVFFSEVQFIAESDLKTIDQLWRKHSNDKFGYSVQKRLWEKSDRDFTKFFIKVGWMKKLDTEVVQYNYRAFPDEFIWELNEETPEGHLPLTNALRGTQLHTCILTHPAFADEDETAVVEDNQEEAKQRLPLGKGLFKSNYSF